MVRRFLALVIFASLSFGVALADSGEGTPPKRTGDILDALHFSPAATLGPDAIRFSMQPSLYGDGVVIEVRTIRDGRHRVTVRWGNGNHFDGWRKTGEWTFYLRDADYEALAADVDSALARPEEPPQTVAPNGEVVEVVCMDGPEFLTERVKGGGVRWLDGHCGDSHPNNAIAARMMRLIGSATDLDRAASSLP